MSKREVNRWVAWVNENLPAVAMLGEPEVQRIVKRAIDDLSTKRIVISFCGAFFGALIGRFVVSLPLDASCPKWQHTFIVVGSAMLFTFVAAKFGDSLLISKIESLASGT